MTGPTSADALTLAILPEGLVGRQRPEARVPLGHNWLCLPREGEGLDIAGDLDPATVESVGGDLDRRPTVYVWRVAADDIQVAQLRRVGRRDDADSVGLVLGAMSRAGVPVQMQPLLVRSLDHDGGHLHSVGLQAEDAN